VVTTKIAVVKTETKLTRNPHKSSKAIAMIQTTMLMLSFHHHHRLGRIGTKQAKALSLVALRLTVAAQTGKEMELATLSKSNGAAVISWTKTLKEDSSRQLVLFHL